VTPKEQANDPAHSTGCLVSLAGSTTTTHQSVGAGSPSPNTFAAKRSHPKTELGGMALLRASALRYTHEKKYTTF
jgi:hypothetical protein